MGIRIESVGGNREVDDGGSGQNESNGNDGYVDIDDLSEDEVILYVIK